MRPRSGPCSSPSSVIRSAAVDHESAPVEDGLGGQLGRDPRPQLIEPPCAGGKSRADVIRLAQREQVLEEAIAECPQILPMNRLTAASDQFAS